MTLKEAIELLRDSGVDSPEYDARELFRVFGNIDSPIITCDASSDSERLVSAVKRRANREPLQYIVGTVGFYREEYKVTPDCLIPRSDTEILVDYAVKNIPKGEIFADLCSGSGCVGISTLKNTLYTRCDAFDVSDGALALTRENARLNGVSDRITVEKKDLLKESPDKEYFAILSNPPYIPREVYEGLEKEIFSEPRLAFVGGEDGLLFYERLTPVCKERLKDGGFIAYEIGYDQAEALNEIAKRNGLSCRIIKDYCGNDRVAVLTK
jgi:release factor glutamine methyltransferase